MKRINKFETLDAEEQQFVLDLCKKHTYTKVVEILAEPRPVGLHFITSSTALCRFYTTHNADAAKSRVLGQYAKSLQVRHQADADGNMQAVLALTQNRLLEALQNGVALKDLASEFRILFNAHKAFLADDRWRKDSKSTTGAYGNYVTELAFHPSCDFIRTDLEEDPGAGGVPLTEFSNETDEEIDIILALRHQKKCAEARELVHKLASGETGNQSDPQNPLLFPSSHAKLAGVLSAISRNLPSQPRVIPHFPPNSASLNPP